MKGYFLLKRKRLDESVPSKAGFSTKAGRCGVLKKQRERIVFSRESLWLGHPIGSIWSAGSPAVAGHWTRFMQYAGPPHVRRVNFGR